MNLEFHISEITRLRKKADKLNTDNPANLMDKIDALAQCLIHIGRVSSHVDEVYKNTYATRKRKFAEEKLKHVKDKEAHAEIAVSKLRDMETEAYGDMMRWRNAFSSTKEELHSYKLRLRIDFEDGGSRYNPKES